jgi:hypothetical protein
MANPTTNYSFAMPTNTDLVKDLPADFDIFGQAVDNRIKALNPETTAGDISYRASTANEKSRLAIGTAGQVLAVNSGATAPEWKTPSAGSLVFIKKVDFTAASTIDFSNSFSATYVNYILIGNYTATADGDLLYRYRVSGADDSTSNYNMQVFDADSTNVTGGRIATGTNGRIGATLASGSRISNTTYFIAPFLAQTKASRAENVRTTSTAITLSQIGTGFNAATSFTGLTIYPGSGTVTGTFAIFGYTNA